MLLVHAMKKDVQELTPRMQKFREAIQAYNVCMSFVKGIHNHISNALLRSLVGGPEGIDRVLRRLRDHASYAYNRMVICVRGDICKELIKDPHLDEMWEVARMDECHQSVVETIKQKKEQKSQQNCNQSGNQGVHWVWSGEDVGD